MRLIDADALRADCDKFNSWDAQIVKAWLDDQPTIGAWTPCSERLPSVGQDVLLSTKDWVAEGIRKANGTWFQFRWEAPLKADEVIAWQPLPEPYKE